MKFFLLNAKLVKIFYICKHFAKKSLTIGINIRKNEDSPINLNKKGKKNGVPPYSYLVNLKSNTMKNTMQSYTESV